MYKVEQVVKNHEYKDAKSMFQEAAQDKKGITPTYKILKSWGPDHKKKFKVGVFLGKEIWGVGKGESKQKAEQSAAENAFKKLSK